MHDYNSQSPHVLQFFEKRIQEKSEMTMHGNNKLHLYIINITAANLSQYHISNQIRKQTDKNDKLHVSGTSLSD